MTTEAPALCGARGYLPVALVDVAVRFEQTAGWADDSDVTRHLRCTLQEHETGDHYGIVMELHGIDAGAVWAHWTPGQFPRELGVLPNCPRGAQGPRPCESFEDHPGACTPELHDPLVDVSRRMSR